MEYSAFAALIHATPTPVILIEGRRSIPDAAALRAKNISALLAARFPTLRFRSGNAAGADEAFTAGVLATAPDRLEIIAPYATHRARSRHPQAHYSSPESLSPEELAKVQTLTITATPANRKLIPLYGRRGRSAAMAACLIRDTMKVTGITPQFPAPTAALFWIDPDAPEAGGTGHTIRVCRLSGVPVIFQKDWESWV